MPNSRAICWAAAGIWLATSLTPPVSSAVAASGEFTVGFRIASYLRVAAEFQALSPEARVGRLRELARNPVRSQEIFPLCRMLFRSAAGRRVSSPNDWERELCGLYLLPGLAARTDCPLRGGSD